MSDIAHKRKRPPTFQHYPENRAKILKKAWVEKAKIRSKWKAQKRREGLDSTRRDIPPHIGDEQDDKRQVEPRGSGRPTHSDSESHTSQNMGSDSEGPNAGSEGADVLTPRAPKLPQRNRKPTNDHTESRDQNKNKDTNKNDEQPSLRKLFQDAYSKSSLHTYKSDPLKRRLNAHPMNNNKRSSRGGGAGAAQTRGRGQPDMKLRMNAMLEKIKRNYT